MQTLNLIRAFVEQGTFVSRIRLERIEPLMDKAFCFLHRKHMYKSYKSDRKSSLFCHVA